MNTVALTGRLPSGKSARIAALNGKCYARRPTIALPVTRSGLLPAETWREIFLNCMVGSVGDLDPANAPLLLRRVCAAWRVIADSTPGLWTSIAVTPRQILVSNVPVIKEWLARSGTTSPLDITIRATPSPPNHSLLLSILAEFLPTYRRWQHIALSIPVELLPMLLGNPYAPLPTLKSLKLTMDYQPHFTVDSPATCLHGDSSLAYPYLVQPCGSHLNIAWEQITHLDVQITGTINEIWDIFFQCPKLLSLAVTAPNSPSIPKIPLYCDRLFRSNVRHLAMSVNAHPAVIGYFRDGLYLPHLQELKLCFIDLYHEMCFWPRTAILDLRKRCLPPLARVAIIGKFILEEDLINFVRDMKHLEQLQVMYSKHDLVTSYVRDLLPQDNAAVLRRQSAYWDEVHETIFPANYMII